MTREAARESLMRWSLNHVLKATVRGARDSRVPLIFGLAGTRQSRRQPERPTGLQRFRAPTASAAPTFSSARGAPRPGASSTYLGPRPPVLAVGDEMVDRSFRWSDCGRSVSCGPPRRAWVPRSFLELAARVGRIVDGWAW